MLGGKYGRSTRTNTTKAVNYIIDTGSTNLEGSLRPDQLDQAR